MNSPWLPHLSTEAHHDLKEIVRWTARRFGAGQARIYRQTIFSAIRDLERGPDIPGSKARDEIKPGLRTLHIARHGQRGRCFLIYRVERPYIRILRILHDSMELGRHVAGAGDGGTKRASPKGES